MHGLCTCHAGYLNQNCSQVASCRYWDEEQAAWSTAGLTVVAGPAGSGELFCETTHLTDFGMISFPTSADALLAELLSIKVNFITLDDIGAMLA